MVISPKDTAKLFFFSSPLLWIVLAYISYLLVLAPGWMLGGEMWAEMATNYLRNALRPDLYHQLLATDAGYIPLPQRLIAWLGRGLPLTVIPFYYTWTAKILSAVLAGVFALPRFRVLVPSDGLRLAACLLVLSLMGFGTRSFINFTYFGAFFLAVLTTLPWSDRRHSIAMPWYAWLMPLLMMSKPSLLAALPALVVTAFCCKSRPFRWITGASVLMGGLQLVQVAISQQHGVMAAQTLPKPLQEKLASAVAYSLGTLGGFMLGPMLNWGLHAVWAWLPVMAGLAIACGLYRWFRQTTMPQRAMAGVGLSLLCFTTLLNNMTLTTDWNLNLHGLGLLRITRHVLPAYAGGVMVLLAIWPDVLRRLPERLATRPVVMFAAWAVLSGWFVYGTAATFMPPSPKVYNGHWQQLASQLATQHDMCIPLDPYGWTFTQGRCRNFTAPQPDWPAYAAMSTAHIAVDQIPSHSAMQGIGVLARPDNTQMVKVQGLLTTQSGQTIEIMAERSLTPAGGLVYIPLPKVQVRHVELMLLTPGTFGHLPDKQPAVQWFGLE